MILETGPDLEVADRCETRRPVMTAEKMARHLRVVATVVPMLSCLIKDDEALFQLLLMII